MAFPSRTKYGRSRALGTLQAVYSHILRALFEDVALAWGRSSAVLSDVWGDGMIGSMTTPALLSASILAADFSNLGDAIQQAQAAGADWIHIDVMDGHFVPNLTMGPVVVRACRRVTDLPLDIHLMIERPEALVPKFLEAGADSITVHVEAGPNLHRTVTLIQDSGCRAGVAINPGTPAEALQAMVSMADLLLVMTVNPGYSGQTYIESITGKIEQVRQLRDRAGSQALIQVDGGIDTRTAPLAANAGAQVYVAAKAIFKHPEGIRAGVESLRAVLQTDETRDRA